MWHMDMWAYLPHFTALNASIHYKCFTSLPFFAVVITDSLCVNGPKISKNIFLSKIGIKSSLISLWLWIELNSFKFQEFICKWINIKSRAYNYTNSQIIDPKFFIIFKKFYSRENFRYWFWNGSFSKTS